MPSLPPDYPPDSMPFLEWSWTGCRRPVIPTNPLVDLVTPMHFNMVHRTRVELVLLGWKPSVLTDRRTVHLPSTNFKRTLSRWLYHSLLPVYYLTKTSRSQQAFCFYFRLFQALFINICVYYNVFLTKSQQLSSLGVKNNFNRQKGGPRIFQSRGPVF